MQKSGCREKTVIVGAILKEHSRNGMIMKLGETNYVFYARNGMECRMWMDALSEGANFRIDRFYEVGEVIGCGRFAEVRAAYDRETGAKAAVKTVRKDSGADAVLQREITVLRSLRHPNVVRTLDVFESSEAYQVVMEFVAGGTLQDRSNDTKELDEAEVRDVMGQILRGLAFIHSSGIVHRDLKPENILLTSDGQVKIADFGMSRFYDACSDRVMKTLVGTPEFVAPEMVRNERYGIEVDAWACGIIMFSLTTGTPPFFRNVVLDNYRKNLVLINWERPGWKRFSSHAQDLNRLLLCVDPSRRVAPVEALYHRWFTARDDQVKTVHPSRPRTCVAQEGRPARSVPATPPSNTEQQLSVSVGSFENTGTTWDYDVQDLSRGTMDSVSYSPAASPRSRSRRPTLAPTHLAGPITSPLTSARTANSSPSRMGVEHVINDKGEVAASSFIQCTGGAAPTRVVLSALSPLCRNVRPENIRPLRINPHSSIGTRLRMERDSANASGRPVVPSVIYRSGVVRTANAGAGADARVVPPGGSSATQDMARQSQVTGSRRAPR